VSQPPDYPGRQRVKRAAAAAGSDAYQGAFEAVGSVLICCLAGYWVDSRWETAPIGLLVGVVVGFAAMVLRLVRLGKEIHPDSIGTEGGIPGKPAGRIEDDPDIGVGVAPGMSSVLRDLDENDGDEDGNGEAK
jgi:hypothetical protein